MKLYPSLYFFARHYSKYPPQHLFIIIIIIKTTITITIIIMITSANHQWRNGEQDFS
jgi:hypothetical protein